MAHYSQQQFVSVCAKYLKKNNLNFNNLEVLDVGSFDLNGSNKKFFGPKYLGVDLVEGPNVDQVLSGENLDKLNKKFDISISCEVFEHAENWKKIFESMSKSLKNTGVLIFTCASTGRIEHGTLRSNVSESPGTMNSYYKNLTKKDFENNFNLHEMFEKYFLFYNFYSFDLYFIGIKNLKFINFDFKLFKKEVNNIKSDTNTIFYKRLFYSYILSDKKYQNFRFFRRQLVNFVLQLLRIK